jgi:3-oxoacyl-[acyl-carrier protein] reductase
MQPGHVSVIVGASRGIGRAVARALARHGGSIVAVARNSDRLAAALEELRECGADGDHRAFVGDASRPDDMQELAATCAGHYGAVDLLVVSAVAAGYNGDSRLPPATRDLTLEAWQRAIDVNVHGAFLANRAFLPMMMARCDGDIINICSSTTPHGLSGTPLAPGYSASKFAVAAFTHVLAEEAAEYGVRVNALFPGPVEAPLIAGTSLARPFGGSVSLDNFAEAVVNLLLVSRNALALDPHILPLPTGRHTGGKSKEPT